MKKTLLIIGITLIACEDNTVAPESRAVGDRGTYTFVTPPDANRPNDVPFIDPDESLFIIDAAPLVVDAAPDVPPPPLCLPAGRREDCAIPGSHGPCATGIRICNLTSWTECHPVVFPRQEACDDIDNDCDGNNNEAPHSQNGVLSRSCYTGAAGTEKEGPCHSGVSLCRGVEVQTLEGLELVYSYGECENQIVPEEEVCDTIDNDCDAAVDEGTLNACSECGPTPVEVCDGVDNDCNGLTDENLLNLCGDCGPAPRELCDFIDNDCDGSIDEDFEDGACVCDHPDYVPQPESCNGIDDDCDGFIDEGALGGPLTKLCSTDILTGEIILYDRREDGPVYVAGECRLGVAFCELGRAADGAMQRGYYECLQEIMPGVERCNGQDEDCDGNIDENFEQGSVAVMMVVDVSGSMEEDELRAAFNATRDSVARLAADGIVDVCYMLAVVGNDDMPDPYLYYPGDTCVPGLEDPRVFPVEDMAAAVSGLRGALNLGSINQGGNTENTLDAIGRFFTDDLIDWDRDGIVENVLWSTNSPQAMLQGVEDTWDVDLSQHIHRVAIILGDEVAQGREWSADDAARAMAHAGGTVFVIGTGATRHSYQPLIDFGATHSNSLEGFRNPQNIQRIEEVIIEALDEAACRQARPNQMNQDNGADAGIPPNGPPDAGIPDAGMACYELQPKKKQTMEIPRDFHLASTAPSWNHSRMCF